MAVATDATTLGAALRDYEARFHARIVQCQDPRIAGAEAANKYFEYLDLKSGSMQLVDVHVLRGDQEICPKRDLAFALEPDDLVDIGELIC
ncbi:hypothetical protein ACG00Y_17315 [Roseateles sp. LYH14W]|uniref:Nuclear transport factor 2 family protein n=1 Tax=Pelomonas parva TaxID=3299032 RepID=A0ABW7F4X5_9BURK